MTHYVLTVPTTFDDNGTEKRRYSRVGVMFQNHRKDTGEVVYSLKLDFPVGATELVAFTPKARDQDNEMID